MLHYSPIVGTIDGEAPEIFPFLGTSRLAEVVDRHGADLINLSHASPITASSTAEPPLPSPSTT